MKTVKRTAGRAIQLNMFLYGEIKQVCERRIEQGEEATNDYIKRLEKKYNLIS